MTNGERIKYLREKNGFTQKDIATKLGVEPAAISKYELDMREPNIEALIKLATIFNVSIDYLLGRTPDVFVNANDKKVFNLLKEEFGLATSTKINKPMQWDFPSIWPPTTYFAYLALLNVGLITEANWVVNTFIKVVDNVYNKTNKLWEKYNVLTGEVCHSFEYETPTMLGWTAGIYSYFYKKR